MSKFHFLLFPLLLPFFTSPSSASSNTNHYYQHECLKVPVPEFVGSLKSTIDIIRDVTSTISNFGGFFGDLRLSNAINDCLDLMDFSADELSWSISASQNPKGKNNSTGNLGSDLKTWLSAAFVNQGTCIDGFDGTNGILKGIVAGGLNQISSLVQELLSQVDSKPNFFANTNTKKGKFPGWFKREDRKLLLINGVTPNAIVAADGSGNFSTIMDAIKAAPDYSLSRYIIYVKKGLYKENVEIKKKKWNLMMIGDGMGATVVSGNRNFVDGWTTFRTATFAVSGRGFIARDITFENTAGPAKHQAVVLRSDSDLSVFYRCEIKGYQDSLYTHTMRQFYRECRISGTVDFIFGDATVVFQNCLILARKGLPNQKNTVTAHGRKDPNQPTGYSIQFCNITADTDLLAVANTTYSYLGRPWKSFSRTVIMQSYMSDAIRPEGWLEWNGDLYLDTLYYGEYLNYGPGAGQGKRVKWPGYHVFNTSTQASNFTVSQFIEGNLWLPSTGVRFTAGLDV